MAGGRKPGPQGSYTDTVDIVDGTMCRAPSAMPGHLGSVRHAHANVDQRERLSKVFTRLVQIAPAALTKELGPAYGDALTGLISSIVVAVKAVAGLSNHALARSQGELPAVQDSAKRILASLNLAFLSDSLGVSSAEVATLIQRGLSPAHFGGSHQAAHGGIDVEPAAEELARAVGILVRLILQGIVLNLLDAGVTLQSPASAKDATAAPDGVVRLLQQVRLSTVGGSLAPWVEQHWRELLSDNQLRRKTMLGPLDASAEIAEALPEPAPAPSALVEPVDAPTLPDADLEAQAATLVLAALDGNAVCAICGA